MGEIHDSEWQINSQGQLETTFKITNDKLLLNLMYRNEIYKYYEDTVNNLIRNALKEDINFNILHLSFNIKEIIKHTFLKYNKPANQKFGTYEINQTLINEFFTQVKQKLNHKNKEHKLNLINDTTSSANSSEA